MFEIKRSNDDIRKDIAKEEENLSRTADQISARIKEKINLIAYVKGSPFWSLASAVGLGFLVSKLVQTRPKMQRIMSHRPFTGRIFKGETAMEFKEPDDGARGRHADHPAKIPAKGWRDILLRMKDQMEANHLSITAAGIAYFAFLAIFPGLAALVSLYGLFSDPMSVQQQLATVQSIMPQEAYTIIENQLQIIATQPQTSLGFGFIGGLVLTLFSANKGVTAMIEAMNIVYEEEERRGFFKLNMLSLFYTFFMILIIVISMILIVIAPAVLAFLPLPGFAEALIKYLPWPFLALIIVFLLNFTYCYFPNRRQAKWRWITYGSVMATGVWILASALFSIYASNFGNFNETYGSVGAVVALMMWFYISAFIVLLGGTLNAEMEHQTTVDSTKGTPKPLGKRDAHMADDVGEKK